jgi:hypothetical protein
MPGHSAGTSLPAYAKWRTRDARITHSQLLNVLEARLLSDQMILALVV